MELDYSASQIESILSAVRNRLRQDSNSFDVKCKRNGEADITGSVHDNGLIYISFDVFRIYVSLNGNNGLYRPSKLFWIDKEIKALCKELSNPTLFSKTFVDRLIMNCFPEIISQEFEKHILEVKDGKEN